MVKVAADGWRDGQMEDDRQKIRRLDGWMDNDIMYRYVNASLIFNFTSDFLATST